MRPLRCLTQGLEIYMALSLEKIGRKKAILSCEIWMTSWHERTLRVIPKVINIKKPLRII